MSVPRWLQWTLGVILPVTFFAVKWSGPGIPELSQPPATTTAQVKEEAPPSPDNPAVIKKVFGSEGNDLRTVTYRMSKEGSPLTCYVRDEEGSQLVKCRFGYSTKEGSTFGKVVEVQVFDARPAAADSAKKAEPLQRLIYTYDASGAPAKPITIDIEPTGIARKLLGTALVGFNPLTAWNSTSTPAAPR